MQVYSVIVTRDAERKAKLAPAHFNQPMVQTAEGMVVLMEIPCAEKQPVQFAGGEFIRIGTNKKNLKEYPDKERELWRTFDSILVQ